MKRCLLPVLLVVPLLAASAQAGITSLWHKDARPLPAERVPQLLRTLRSDGDEGKRVAAADELRLYDPVAFPEIIPTLLDALHNDKKPSVRSEAAESLGRFRPVSQQVGQALELARDKDSSMRVRLQARRELLSYRWGGYRSGKPEDGPTPTTKEPPLAPPLVPGPNVNSVPNPLASTPPAITTTPAPLVQRLPITAVPAPVETPPRTTGPELPPQE
jgi:hypothetical protein